MSKKGVDINCGYAYYRGSSKHERNHYHATKNNIISERRLFRAVPGRAMNEEYGYDEYDMSPEEMGGNPHYLYIWSEEDGYYKAVYVG